MYTTAALIVYFVLASIGTTYTKSVRNSFFKESANKLNPKCTPQYRVHVCICHGYMHTQTAP